MKTEEFDDAIRGKFNTPIPPVSEAEVDAVFRNINHRRLAKGNFQWRRYAIVTAIILLFGGLLFWNIQLNTTQQDLAKELKQLNERIDQTNTIKTEEKSNLIQEKAPITPLPYKNSESNSNGSITPAPTGIKGVTNPTKSTSTVLAIQESNNSNKTYVSVNTEETNQQPDTIDNKVYTDSIISSTTASTYNLVEPEETKQKPDVKKPTNKFKFSTGISADFSIPFTGINLLGDAQFGKHWSITSGLRYLTFGDELFENEEEYNEKSHEEFKERFKAHIVDSMEIDEIEIHDQFLQIPILLNYHFPINNGFEMLLSIGGDMNIYYKKKVEFVSRPKTQSNFETPVELIEKPDFKTVHDIRLGFGIQKHWNRYSIQLIPEAVYLFNTPNVLVKPFNPSIRIGAFYRI